jgi:hypothetical protein
MAIGTIKTNFHQLIDRIENEELLTTFYQLMNQRSQQQDGELWQSLTTAEKDELLLSDEESKAPENWIADKEVRLRHQQWLRK